MSLSYPATSPHQIKKGDSDVILVTLLITEPAAPFKFTIKQPLGYDVNK